MRDPLAVLKVYESGIGNVVSVLTDTISAQQLKTIYGLMNEKGCNGIDLA